MMLRTLCFCVGALCSILSGLNGQTVRTTGDAACGPSAWRLVYANDSEGKDAGGNREDLLAGIRRGSPVRVNWSEASASEGWSVEEFAEAGFLNIMGGREVVAQLNPGFIQSHYTDATRAGWQAPLRDWIAIISTTGKLEAVMVERATGRTMRKLVQRTRVNWFVYSPPANCDNRQTANPPSEQRNQIVENVRYFFRSDPVFDAGLLKQGLFHYGTLVQGKPSGGANISIRQQGNNFAFSNQVTGAFAQSWQSVSTNRLNPVSARLSFGQGSQAREAFDLSYGESGVSGRVTTTDGESHSIKATIPGDCIDQRIDWAAAMALPDYTPGLETGFYVFDPTSGLAQVQLRVGEAGFTRVPAGIFSTIRVSYDIVRSGKQETFVLYLSKDLPRFLVREDFPNGLMIELTSVE
jgi:hypothetical protein